MLKRSKEHLEETEWTYWYHLRHSFMQSNRLISTAIKSYIHGIFPCWFKSDGPKTIFRMYHQIKRIRHIEKMEREMKDNGEL
jgi:hypothetical protein